MTFNNIYFVHPGRAAYPELQAYKSYFSSKYNVYIGSLKEYEAFEEKADTILWCIMGFYPQKAKCGYLIHDYRSLSVGKLASCKDKIKKLFNVRPNLRIFLNQAVEGVMGFNDSIPSTNIDMGLPKWVKAIKPHHSITGDFCYIGEITFERKLDKIIDSFLENQDEDKIFVLVGRPQAELKNKYQDEKRIIFTGFLPQKEALSVVKSCEFAVCSIPHISPYIYQTPTKLIEYAGLGAKIICNDSLSNLNAINKYGISACVQKGNIFEDLITNKVEESSILFERFTWKHLIENSKVESYF